MSVYAYKNIEAEVMKSSSGGAFIKLCEAFEQVHEKGKVAFYGACLQKDMTVRHCAVYSAEECHCFQGSKYVKSQLNDCYEQVLGDLQRGLWVLFSGTPCQVYALKKITAKHCLDTEKLFVIDIVCHGIAKKQVWDDYKRWLESKVKSDLIEYSFRYKPEGWKAYPGFAKFNNGTLLVNTAETSIFSKLHLLGYSIESGCFKCPFANEKRISDITLGDYWGIEEITQEISYKTGVSLIICNSSIGENIISTIEKDSSKEYGWLLKTTGRGYINYQNNLQKPTEQPEGYQKFWNDYKTMEFEDVIRKYLGWGRKYRICYLIKKAIRKTALIELYRRSKR